MFRIKICGITNLRDADAAITADAEALGLNFYDKSPRRVGLDEAVRISRLAAVRKVAPVGVFVNHLPDEIDRIAAAAELAFIQLHGDEPPECVAQVVAQLRRFVIRARRIGDDGVAAVLRDIEACRAAGAAPGAVLIDALTPGRYGGTGETVSWMGLADHERWLRDTPLILAGGLTPDNVAEAIRIVRPHAVDVASGVESAPGKKDPHKVRDFVAAAKAAFGL